ncbi:MAG: MerR family transcriptional regulator, partial [Candidatus Sericytochromatia bacterium]
KNLERLQQILFFKEIGFSLDEIKVILDDPNFDRKKALDSHKNLLFKKKERIEEMIKTIDKTIKSIERGEKMKEKEMFKGFDIDEIEKHKKIYSDEVKEKWGNTSAYKESDLKTSNYNKDNWKKISESMENIYKKISDNMDKGIYDPLIQKYIGEWRQHITDNFYNCTTEIFRELGNMYVYDKRFTKNIDKYKEGLSVFLRDAMNYYCDKLNE